MMVLLDFESYFKITPSAKPGYKTEVPGAAIDWKWYFRNPHTRKKIKGLLNWWCLSTPNQNSGLPLASGTAWKLTSQGQWSTENDWLGAPGVRIEMQPWECLQMPRLFLQIRDAHMRWNQECNAWDFLNSRWFSWNQRLKRIAVKTSNWERDPRKSTPPQSP